MYLISCTLGCVHYVASHSLRPAFIAAEQQPFLSTFRVQFHCKPVHRFAYPANDLRARYAVTQPISAVQGACRDVSPTFLGSGGGFQSHTLACMKVPQQNDVPCTGKPGGLLSMKRQLEASSDAEIERKWSRVNDVVTSTMSGR